MAMALKATLVPKQVATPDGAWTKPEGDKNCKMLHKSPQTQKIGETITLCAWWLLQDWFQQQWSLQRSSELLSITENKSLKPLKSVMGQSYLQYWDYPTVSIPMTWSYFRTTFLHL